MPVPNWMAYRSVRSSGKGATEAEVRSSSSSEHFISSEIMTSRPSARLYPSSMQMWGWRSWPRKAISCGGDAPKVRRAVERYEAEGEGGGGAGGAGGGGGVGGGGEGG